MNSLKAIARRTLDKFYPYIYKRTLHNHRVAIAERIFVEFGGTIKYGPFKGLVLVPELKDLTPDFPSMFFGTYEQELLNSLRNLPTSYVTLINLGAGDGYYPIGAIKSGMFEKSIAYEASELRRNQIERLAMVNNCQNGIVVREFADINCFDEYDLSYLSKCVVLCDIEGGEFDLFNKENLVNFAIR